MTFRKGSAKYLLVLLAGLALAVGTSTDASAAASAPAPSGPVTRTFTGPSGETLKITTRALTRSEITSRGLARYVDMSKLAVSAPSLTGAADAASAARATAPKRKPAGAVSTFSSGCWNTEFGRGVQNVLYVYTDVDWCGDGTWVTYANSTCNGYSYGPTWNFESCNNYANYGVGWNLYRVKTTWRVCLTYIPWPVGACGGIYEYPWMSYQFLGSGAVQYLGTGG